jgi:alkaline phosphatase D
MSIDVLLDTPCSRRRFLKATRDIAALVAASSVPAFGEQDVRLRSTPFTLGVASGDPLPDGVVLWTRLDRDVLEQTGIARARVPVHWEVASDDMFRRVVRRGSHVALPELGHSVHAEVEGLLPGRTYWYRFMAGGEVSATGRTRTAAAAEEALDRFRFAFVSCQHYEQGYFTAYRRLAAEDLDLVVHLGDYIYERPLDRTPVRPHDAGEPFTLEDYRARHALYRADADLQAAHAAFPWVVTPDDHEVVNDYAGDTPETDETPPEQFLLRRTAAYQAYYEFMPLRRSSLPAGPAMRIFRRFGFGRLVTVHVLDTRQFRSDQPCGSDRKPRCAEALSPAQRMLGVEQERWLRGGLRASDARWNVLANQVPIMELAQVANGTRTFPMDKWDGYVHERTRLLRFLADARPSNPIVITGDMHSNWVADLKLDFASPSSAVVGTEFVGTSISSGGDGSDSTSVGTAMLAQNPHIKFYNSHRGYVRCTVTPSSWTTDIRTLPYVRRPGAPIGTRASFVVESGRPGAHPA